MLLSLGQQTLLRVSFSVSVVGRSAVAGKSDWMSSFSCRADRSILDVVVECVRGMVIVAIPPRSSPLIPASRPDDVFE